METLDRLFSEARNEAPETTLSDVQKWIVPMTLGALIIAFFAKTKLIVTLKPFIMISSAIVTVGIGAGTIFLMNTSTEQKQEKPIASKEITTPIKQNPKPNEIVLATVNTPSQKPVAKGEQQPVLRMLEILNDDVALLPSLSYCQSLPMNYVMPYKPYEPVPPVKTSQVTDEEIEINDFTTLKIWGAVDVVLIQGDKAGIRVENRDESADVSLTINTNGQTLEVSTDCKKNNCNFDITVYITFVDIKEIKCSGASTIKAEGRLTLENLEMEVSGASEIELEMDLKKFELIASGASEIALEGSAQNAVITNSGATEVKAENFSIKKGNVNCSGASEMSIYVTDNLDLVVSGASEVNYKGSPNFGKKSVTGASELKNIE